VGDAVLGEFVVELREWIAFEAMLGAGEERLARIRTNEAIPANGLGGRS
jgi:hypothetical protein